MTPHQQALAVRETQREDAEVAALARLLVAVDVLLLGADAGLVLVVDVTRLRTARDAYRAAEVDGYSAATAVFGEVCGAVHPWLPWRCALPRGHAGDHDGAPAQGDTQKQEEVAHVVG